MPDSVQGVLDARQDHGRSGWKNVEGIDIKTRLGTMILSVHSSLLVPLCFWSYVLVEEDQTAKRAKGNPLELSCLRNYGMKLGIWAWPDRI